MRGRRGGRGGRGGGAAAKRAAAPPVKGAGRTASALPGDSLASFVQNSTRNRRGTTTATSTTTRVGNSTAAAPAQPHAEDEEEVLLLCRTPATRHTKSSGAASSAAPASTSVPATAEAEVLAFWRRACGDVNRSCALANCGVTHIVVPAASAGAGAHRGATHSLTQDDVFRCGEDRLRTAVLSLRNAAALVCTPSDTSAAAGAPSPGTTCWVRAPHCAAVAALARVCEAAVPLSLPPLLKVPPSLVATSTVGVAATSLAGVRGTGDSGGKSAGAQSCAALSTWRVRDGAVELVPSPVLLADVERRLGALRRLHQLRVAYTGLLPRLRAAATVAELRRALFAHDPAACHALGRVRLAWQQQNQQPPGGSTGVVRWGLSGDVVVAEMLSSFLGNPVVLDVVLPLVGITARHPQEEALLQHFAAELRRVTAVDPDAWGPMAAMASWRCTDGLYVVQHASRVRVLRRLLKEAQFYGLPRFLRSIRAMAGQHVLVHDDVHPQHRGTAGGGSSTGAGPSPPAVTGHDGASASVEAWLRAAALQRAQRVYPDQFFLTPDGLDPELYSQPDPMQAQLVQEELVTLQRTHGAFCLVVGEADEVVTLLHRHLAHAGGAWQQRIKKDEPGVKAEPRGDADVDVDRQGAEAVVLDDDADEDAGIAAARPRRASHATVDPLQRYVLRTVDAARQQQQQQQQQRSADASAVPAPSLPFSHVQWMEHGSTNRWSPNAHYYGLAYMVVLETEEEWATESGGTLLTEGLLPETAIAMDASTDTAALRAARVPAYCVNAVLELWRT